MTLMSRIARRHQQRLDARDALVPSTVERSVTVGVPPAAAWAGVLSTAGIALAHEGPSETFHVPGTPFWQPGMQVCTVCRCSGPAAATVHEVERVTAGRDVTFRLATSGIEAASRWTFEDAPDGGTHLTYRQGVRVHPDRLRDSRAELVGRAERLMERYADGFATGDLLAARPLPEMREVDPG